MMNEKPKRKKNTSMSPIKVIAIGVGALIVGCGACFVIFFGVLYAALSPMTGAASDYLDALRSENYEVAFDYLSFNLKQAADDPQRLGSLMLEYNALPESWNFSNQSVENNTGQVSGGVQLKNGESMSILIRLQLEDENWRVTYFEWGRFSSEDL